MSLWHIAWRYLWNRKLTTVLTILSVALGVGLIVSVLTLREETQRRFEQEGQAFDLVVGAKGNPLQLVLSTVYFLDVPTGNIKKDMLEALRGMEDVEGAFPVAMGDTFRGFRIVGTTLDLMRFTPGG
ncbi:MAG TPA: ABC transporter permease, partial [Candidatus Hydrogenedentes bacterium]|nr:ABC transporter permease [Candidatus Hydrogenedentota bacterium]